ncbi:MAG: hypothetical protein C0597_03540, partial [Marinilabiliales bacterium]
RILKCIQIIKESHADDINLHNLKKEIHLSASRLRHLFKQETGTTIKKFLRHRKLVKSLQAMFENKNLTESSFIGGFSDQPHFTKTFKHSFGIKPSKSKNSL